MINVRQTVPPLHQYEYSELLQNDVTKKLIDLLHELPDVCAQHFDSHNFYLGVDEIVRVLHAANAFVETFKPWELRKNPDDLRKLETLLRVTFETLRVCGILLQPIVPEISTKLLNKLNVNASCKYWSNARVDFQSAACADDVSLGAGDAILFKRIR